MKRCVTGSRVDVEGGGGLVLASEVEMALQRMVHEAIYRYVIDFQSIKAE